MFNRLVLIAGAAALVAAGSAWSADGFSLEGEPKIALLYFKAKNDGGWSQAFDEAKPKIEANMAADPLCGKYAEDAARSARGGAIHRARRQRHRRLGLRLFRHFPELSPEVSEGRLPQCGGTTNGTNLQSFYGRTYECQYLCGMAAGAMSKTGKLGFVAANPFGMSTGPSMPTQLGAKKMNPNAT